MPLPATLWSDIFGNSNPVEIEIGPGTGTFLLAIAEQRPGVNYYAVERAWRRYRQLSERLERRRLENVRLIAADAGCIVSQLVPDRSVAAYHIYFPDPWWKTRHAPRRLFTPRFAAELRRTLTRDGVVYFASDVEQVDAAARAALLGTGLFSLAAGRRSPRNVMTSFERKGLARGAGIYDAVFEPRSG